MSKKKKKKKYPLVMAMDGRMVEPRCYQDKAPEGWYCSRKKGHEGPCAAHEMDPGM